MVIVGYLECYGIDVANGYISHSGRIIQAYSVGGRRGEEYSLEGYMFLVFVKNVTYDDYDVTASDHAAKMDRLYLIKMLLTCQRSYCPPDG